MKPVLALVGRPNVGKSTLFNRLTRTRDALVADFPGLTRDRQYGDGKIGERAYVVVDTGGIGEGDDGIDGPMGDQARQAVSEADAVLFLVDGRAGLTAADEMVARELRSLNKPVHLVINKVDGVDENIAASEFYALGLTSQHRIAASHGRGVNAMIADILAAFPDAPEHSPGDENQGIRVAIIGRPNVGKSTLVNRMLGEERVVVFDMAGTTRDSIYIPFERRGQRYTLIDTAGVRRRGKVHETIEKFSVIKAMQAIDDAQVVVLVIDAREGITDQDLSLLGHTLQAGRSLLVAVNKWDGLDAHHREQVKAELGRRLEFAPWARVHFISALHGTGVGDLFGRIERAWQSAFTRIPTHKLTEMLEQLVAANQPPMVGRHRAKLRYAHIGGTNPPRIIVHGSALESLPDSYRRYLENRFRELLKLEGTPLKVEFKAGENPYAGKANKLTDRQVERKRRLMRHVKGK
jgi:GTP-binding protein